MRCPECGTAELVNYPNAKECPHCHFMTYFGMTIKNFRAEPDFEANF